MENEAGKATGVDAQAAQIGDLISNFDVGDKKASAPKAGVKDGSEQELSAEAEEGAEEAGAAGGGEEKEGGDAEKTAEKGEKESEVEALRAQVNELMAKIAALEGRTTASSQQPQTGEQQSEQKKDVFDSTFFESKEEFDKYFEDQAVANKVLSRVAVNTAQRILANLPRVVDNIVKQQVEVQSRVRDFFEENKDLVKHKQFVGFVANDLSGKNPGWTIDKLFSELGREVRRRIGLKTRADGAAVRPGASSGAFPPVSKGSRPPVKKPEQLSQLEKEINDLIE